jgi:hypothetical protein
MILRDTFEGYREEKQMPGVYVLGGITLESEIPLPELTAVQHEEATAHRVRIRVGAVAAALPGAVALDAHCYATPTQYLLHIDGIARYLVSHGEEIVVSPFAGALPLDVRAYLLGTIFVVLCQQRGLLPLHASAVSSEQGVVAFLGQSGQGKSSLAAHLAARGFAVIADDICLIDPSLPGAMMVAPTAPWLKLWRRSLEHLGQPADALARVFSEDDKYRLPLGQTTEPQPLRTLMFLAHDAAARTVTIEAVSALEAVPLLMNLTHQAYLLQATGQREESFLRCSRVSSHARAFRLLRPWGLEHMEATVDALESVLRG